VTMRALGRTLGLAAALCAASVPGPGAAQQKPKAAAPAAKASAAAAAPTGAAAYKQKYAEVCAACHGANGRSDMPGTPVLAGQHSFYVVTQLFLFREGRRANEAMTAVAKTMKDDDLRGYSEFIGTLPPVPPPPAATPPDAARMARGQALATQHKCLFCHGADLGGGQQVPRIAGQHEDYLRDTLHGFKSGKRPGYTQAMFDAVSQTSLEDLDTLAYFAARFPMQGAKAAGPASAASGR
jgi:cytochrome c553